MKIFLTTLEGNIYPLEVSNDLEILDLKALCEQETNIPVNQMSLTHDGRPLNDDKRSLASYSIKDNDMIMVQKIKADRTNNLPFIDFSSITVPQSQPNSSSASNASAANNFRNMLMSDSRQFAAIQQRFPELANAIQRGDTCK